MMCHQWHSLISYVVYLHKSLQAKERDIATCSAIRIVTSFTAFTVLFALA